MVGANTTRHVRQARDAGYPGLRITGEMTSDARPVADTARRLAPGLRRVLGVVGWDRTSGLRFASEVDPA